MPEYLVFQLYGPLAAWGEVAVGESRGSASRPTKSSVLGLLAACLGIRRDQEAELAELDSGLHFAAKCFAEGQALRDYHTAQMPSATSGVRYATRRAELIEGKLRRGELQTILSDRDYRQDAYALVALRSIAGDAVVLDRSARALRSPDFVPYLGRRSCPPALPFAPKVLKVPGLASAFRRYEEGPEFAWPQLMERLQRSHPRADPIVWFEGEDSELAPEESFTRIDALGSRARWQYRTRIEHRARSRETG